MENGALPTPRTPSFLQITLKQQKAKRMEPKGFDTIVRFIYITSARQKKMPSKLIISLVYFECEYVCLPMYKMFEKNFSEFSGTRILLWVLFSFTFFFLP